MGLGRQTVGFIIAGLGNPGREYENTRHNAGFRFIDYLCGRTGIKTDKLKHMGLCGRGVIGGHGVLVVKPQTYMNESGECVADAARFYKIPPEKVIVISDDINLDSGRIRVRRGGSDGGQKGLKSIIACLGTEDFPRIRIGVGGKPRADYDLGDWVLSAMTPDESRLAAAEYDRIFEALGYIMDGDVEKAMQTANGKQ